MVVRGAVAGMPVSSKGSFLAGKGKRVLTRTAFQPADLHHLPLSHFFAGATAFPTKNIY